MLGYLLALFLLVTPLYAQNRVLELDGDGDYVELPRGIFNHLEAATIEGWVRWDEFRFWAQFFAFGTENFALGINHMRHTPNLQFFIVGDNKTGPDLIRVHQALTLGQWIHLAAVSGPGGMALYINGTHVGRNDYTGSFAAIDSAGHRNYLGHSHRERNADLKGQLDELRVWGVARTGEQIRADMCRSLRGDEPGLVGLWNFDGGDARDASPNGHHGQLFGDAHTVERPFFSPDEAIPPLAINGFAHDAEGVPLRRVRVRALQQGRRVKEVGTNAGGQYRLVVFTRDSLDVEAEWQGTHLVARDTRVAPGEEEQIDWRLLPQAGISGKVRTLDDTPQQGVVIQLVRAGAAGEGQVVRSVMTAGDGGYRFEHVPAGAYQVRCYSPGKYVYYRDGRSIDVGAEGQRLGVNIRLVTVKPAAWETYDYVDGLDATRVSAMYQDDAHVLWLGTPQGLYHYDGAEFTRRGVDLLHLESWEYLAGSGISNFSRDSTGRLWLATSNAGIVGFDGVGFVRVTEADGLPSDGTGALLVDRDDNLWIGARSGLSRYDGESFTHFTEADGLAGNWVKDLFEDSAGRLWIATSNGISSYDGETLAILDVSRGLAKGTVAGNDGLGLKHVQCIAEDATGNLWFGTKGGALRYDGRDFKIVTRTDGLIGEDVRDIHLDRDGDLWFVANGAGISRYDGLGFVNYTLADGLADVRVTNIYETADGALWTGFFGAKQGANQGFGISSLPAAHLVHFDVRDGLTSKSVYGVQSLEGGDLLLRMQRGLMRYDGERFTPFEPVAGLVQQQVTRVYEATRDTLYFATEGAGVWRYDGHEARRFTAADGLASNYVRDLLRAVDGALFFATLEGLSRYDGRTFRNYTMADGLPSDDIRDLYEDEEGLLWLATARGVAWFDGEDFSVLDYADRRFTRPLQKDNMMAGTQIQAIHEGLDGAFFFASTRGYGHYTGTDLHWSTRVNARNEGHLSNNNVEAIHQSPDGLLWVATHRGLNLFDGTAWSTLDASDGLPDERVFDMHFGDGGEVWLATGAGLTRYRRSALPPRARVERVIADRLHERWAEVPAVEIGKPVSIEIGTSTFHTPKAKRQYRYRIAEIDSAWSETTRRNRYEWVPESTGAYTFQAQAIDRDLNYSEPVSVLLKVIVPWQRNAWIVVPMAGGVLGLLGLSLFSSVRYYRQRRESAHLREALLAEERRAREAAETANRAKSLFLANMSHEVRTPLNAVLGYARIVGDDSRLPEALRYGVLTIQRSGRHLLGLINDVLDIARIESGQVEIRAVDFDLHGLLQGLVATFRPRCADKGLEWREEGLPQDATWVHGDEAKLGQVLMNLLANAVKFTREGHVELTLEQQSEDVYCFSVRDSGPGFDAGEGDVLFEPFQQGEAGKREGGTGLGLAIARRNIDALGGKLRWESTSGTGSVFSFAVHMRSAEAPRGERDGKSVQVMVPGQRWSALVVDDVLENREVLEQLLSRMGCQTTTAENGERAIEEVERMQPDIIFMDIRMPGMDGIETAEKLWAQYGRDQMKIAAISASVLEQERQRHRDAGFDFMLDKPVSVEQIVKCLQHVLGVDFVDVEDEPAEPVPVPIDLPEDLVGRLLEATEYYNITDLGELIAEVEKQGESGRQWAGRLRERADRYDMEGVLALLREMGHGE